MQLNLILYSFLSFVFSYLILYFFESNFANRLLEKPNHRSSHLIPKPSGGGISFVFSFSFFSILLGNKLPIICLPLAALGFLDDLFDLNRVLRYSVQVLTAFLILYQSDFFMNYFLGMNPLFFGLIFITIIILVTAIINFINFMDGIDGLVCTCLIFIFISASILINPYLIILVGSLLGFLLWNWHPSKVFMGDIGSTFLGAVLAGTMLQANNFEIFLRLIIISSPLLLDAFVCLIRRFLAKQNIFYSHSLHLYQRLYQAGWSHSKVTFFYSIPTVILSILSIYGNLIFLFSTIIVVIIFGIYVDLTYSVPFKVSLKNSKK